MWQRIAAVALVAAAIAADFIALGPAIVVLNVGLAAALLIWCVRDATAIGGYEPVRRALLVLLVLQALHFGEEYATGFQERFPTTVGYAWSDTRFVVFNVVWLGVFGAAAMGLARRFPLALLPAWFLGLVGGIGNGVLHLAMSAASRGYYPGAATAPLLLVGGTVLVRRLATRASAGGSATAGPPNASAAHTSTPKRNRGEIR
jgi:hypothetical protein